MILRVMMMHLERLGVMMYSDKMRVMYLEKMRVEMLRILQGTKSKVMQMLEERVNIDEGLLLNKHMVVIS